ncbi:hypothetical protein U1Q18_039334 [Sarracenia purpurea var. burkii]
MFKEKGTFLKVAELNSWLEGRLKEDGRSMGWTLRWSTDLRPRDGAHCIFVLPSKEASCIQDGEWVFSGQRLFLDWWSHFKDCYKSSSWSFGNFVRVMSFAHLRSNFETNGNLCGGIAWVDDDTAARKKIVGLLSR